ncbi:MAG: hypothetical protein K6G73_12195 [Marinilabiliaceae bacterium]|nr:hypothetical protein [Marinilabiliaceae bacterium]
MGETITINNVTCEALPALIIGDSALAKILGVTVRTVQRYNAKGYFEGVRLLLAGKNIYKTEALLKKLELTNKA